MDYFIIYSSVDRNWVVVAATGDQLDFDESQIIESFSDLLEAGEKYPDAEILHDLILV